MSVRTKTCIEWFWGGVAMGSTPHPRLLVHPRSLLAYAVILFVAAFFHWGFQVRTVSGESMMPTLPNSSIVVMERWPGHVLGHEAASERIERGDVVSMDAPMGGGSYVKRVVGVPGDHIEIRGGKLTVSGTVDPLPTPLFGGKDVDLVLGDGQFYALGDHRDASYDSREFGVVHSSRIHGRVTMAFSFGTRAGERPILMTAR